MRELLYGAAYYDEYMPYERAGKRCCHDEKSRDQYGSDRRIHMEHLRTAGRKFLTFHM